MRVNNFLYRVRCKGNNLNSLMSSLSGKGLKLVDVSRDDGLEFSITRSDYKVFKSLDLGGYEITLLHAGGGCYAKYLFLSKLGGILGLIVAIALYIFVSHKIFFISISGTTNIDKIELYEGLKNIGIERFKTMPTDTEYIEEYLSNTFDFSLVSVITKGDAIIINVKEELPNVSLDGNDIVAEYDMVINSIEVYSGTAMVRAGDIVKCGEVLVSSNMTVGESLVSVEPKAKITATRYVSESHSFLKEETQVVRTGNKKILASKLCMGKRVFWESNSQCEFEFFEEENIKTQVSNYFLPITIEKTVAYEITDIIVEHDFESEKNDIIEGLKEKCYSSADGNTILSEDYNIVPMNFGYIINYHLGVEYVLNV